jgi:hypothetical protein
MNNTKETEFKKFGDKELECMIDSDSDIVNKYMNERLSLYNGNVHGKFDDIIHIEDIFTISLKTDVNLTDEIFNAINKFTRVNIESINYNLINKLTDDVLILKFIGGQRSQHFPNTFGTINDERSLRMVDERYFDAYGKMSSYDPFIIENLSQPVADIKFPEKLIVLELAENYCWKLDNLPKTLKKLTIRDIHYNNDIYLPKEMERFECLSTNDYNIYLHEETDLLKNKIKQEPSKNKIKIKLKLLNTKNKKIINKFSDSLRKKEPKIINKFPDSLCEIIYGGKEITLPEKIESFFYCGNDSYKIKGEFLTDVGIIIQNNEQTIDLSGTSDLCQISVFLRKNIIHDIIFPQKMHCLKIIGGNKINIDININSKTVYILYVSESFMLNNIVDNNIKRLSLLKNEMSDGYNFIDGEKRNTKKIYRSYLYLPSSLTVLEIQKYKITRNDNSNNKFNTNLEYNEFNNDFEYHNSNEIYNDKMYNLPNRIEELFINPNRTIKKIKIPYNVTELVLARKYNVINNLPKRTMSKIVNMYIINKSCGKTSDKDNDFGDFETKLGLLAMISKRNEADLLMYQKILNEELSKNRGDQRQEFIDEMGLKINKLVIESEHGNPVMNENRIIRNINLKKLSNEEVQKEIDEKIEIFIEELSKSNHLAEHIKFNNKLLKKNIIIKAYEPRPFKT